MMRRSLQILLGILALSLAGTADAATILSIEDRGDGTGAPVLDLTISTDDTLRLYAVWREAATDSFIGTASAVWTVFSSDKGTVTPGTGTTTLFDAKKTGTAVIMATSGSFSDFTGLVTINPGVLDHVTIRDAGGGAGSVVQDHILTTDDTLTVFAAGYDADENYLADEVVDWSTLWSLDPHSGTGISLLFDPFTANTSGFIVADHPLVADDTTGLIRVANGRLDHFSIRTGNLGNGVVVGDTTLSAGDTLLLYSAGYDADGNFISNSTSQWRTTGTLDTHGNIGILLSFEPSTSGTAGYITVEKPDVRGDSTGLVTVIPGPLADVRIWNGPDPGSGVEVAALSLTTDTTLVLYALGFDGFGNFVGRETVVWSVTGSVGNVAPLAGDSVLFDPTGVGSGVVQAQHPLGFQDQTGILTVAAGALDHILILDAPPGLGGEIGDVSMTDDDTLSLFAAGYDLDGNTLGPHTVDWSTIGTLDPQGANGTSFVFRPASAPAVGRVVAAHVTAGEDSTGTINVVPGGSPLYVAGSWKPLTVSSGESYAFDLEVENTGVHGILLDRALTRLEFGADFGDTLLHFSSSLDPASNNYIEAGSAGTTLRFAAGTVPATLPPGSYAGRLRLVGESGGSARTDTLNTGPDAVGVQAPPQLSYLPGSLSPLLTSQGSALVSSLVIDNTGEADLLLDPASSRIWFSDGADTFSADVAMPPVLPGASATTLTFSGETVDPSLDPGRYQAILELTGVHNGKILAARLDSGADSVQVELAPDLVITEVVPSQGAITRGMTRPWSIDVTLRNNGGSPVDLDSARVSLYLATDGNREVTAGYAGLDSAVTGFLGGGTLLAGGGAERTLRFQVSRSDTSVGTVILAARAQLHDAVGGQAVEVETGSGGGGLVVVEEEARLVLDAVLPSQPVVVSGQPAPWRVFVALRNASGASGRPGSSLRVDPQNVLTSLRIEPGPWQAPIPADSLAQGTNTLTAGERDTLVFDVSSTPVLASGPRSLAATIAGVELNSGRALLDSTGVTGAGSVDLIQPASLVIDSVSPAVSRITENQSEEWTVTLGLSNPGESPLALEIADTSATFVRVEGGSGFGVRQPSALVSGGTTLPGGASGELVFTFEATGTVSSPGAHALRARVAGSDAISYAAIYDDTETPPGAAAPAILVDAVPNLAYVPGTLTPAVVNKGITVSFSVGISNVSGASTVRLDPGGTTFLLSDGAGGSYQAFLDPLGPDSVAGGGQSLLLFHAEPLDPGFASGSFDASVLLSGTENGHALAPVVLSASPDRVTVQDAPELAITSVTASQPRVTAGSSVSWAVIVRLENGGATDVDLILSPAGDTTDVSFLIGSDVTSEYAYGYPTALAGSGSNRLVAGATDSLVFDITTTGNTTGLMTLNAAVTGRNIASGALLTTNTFAGGSGSVRVDAPPDLRIVRLDPSHPKLTLGIPVAWEVRVALENRGQAGVRLDLASSSLQLTGGGSFPSPPPPVTTGSGTLPGGGADTLVFSLSGPGTVAGSVSIGAIVSGFDVNMGSSVAAPPPATSGSLLLQDPARLALIRTELLSPNAPRLNTGQSSAVVIEVANSGQAEAASVLVELSSSLLVTVPDSIAVASIAGGATHVDTFVVTAPSAGPDTLRSFITNAADANSGAPLSPGLFQGAHTDSIEAVLVQVPADLDVISLRAIPPLVAAGQTSDWEARVLLRNAGGADLRLDPPAAEDLVFRHGAAVLNDYLVIPPSSFSGSGGLTLPGGGADSLSFIVSTTGTDTGWVSITAGLSATDSNDLGTRSAARTDSVYVTTPPSLYLASVTTNAPHQPLANTTFLNTDQALVATVTVRNDGGEDADSVTVRLTASPSAALDSLAVAAGSDSMLSLPAGTSATFDFFVRTGSSPTPLVRLQASIVKATSTITGTPLAIGPALDADENLVVQAPALLEITSAITAPPGALDDTLSAGQTFEVSAAIDNLGEASLGIPARVRIELPFGYASLDSLERSFTPGVPVSPWSISAPTTPSLDTLRIDFTAIPNDLNIAAPAALSSGGTPEIRVLVEPSGSLSSPSLAVDSPGGAADSVLSTEQIVRVRATILASPNAGIPRATLSPTGLTLLGPPTQSLSALGGGLFQATWDLLADAVAGSSSASVGFSASDLNSGAPLGDSAGPLDFAVVQKPDLALTTGAILSPQVAVGGIVTQGMNFLVGTRAVNFGTAGIDTSGARASITLPSGYQLASFETAVKPFALGDSLRWWVRAPDVPTGQAETILLTLISPYPDDENTNQPAFVSAPATAIAVQTKDADVTVTNVTPAGSPPSVAPRGEAGLLVMRLVLDNLSSEGAVLDSVGVTLLGPGSAPLGNPAAALSRLWIEGRNLSSPGDLGVNPVPVVWANKDTLVGQGADTLNLYLDVSPSASVPEFSVAIATASDIHLVDVVSGSRVGVRLSGGGGSFAQSLRAGPVVLMQRSFEEYVHNYPNPFRAGGESTRIAYYLERDAGVRVEIYTLLGEEVWSRSFSAGDPEGRAGAREILWDGRNASGRLVRNGLYVCRVSAGSLSTTFRIAVAK